jgi:hypothetical protein
MGTLPQKKRARTYMKVIPGSGFPETKKQTGSGPDYPPMLLMIILPARDLRQAFPNNNQNLVTGPAGLLAPGGGRQAAGGPRVSEYRILNPADGYLNVIPGDPP